MQYQNPNTNFISQAPRDVRQVRVGPKRWPFIILALFLVIVIAGVFCVPYAVLGIGAYREAQAGKTALEQAQQYAEALKLEEAGEYADIASEHFSAAHRNFSSFKVLFWVPWVGTQIKAVDNILVSGKETAGAISELLDIAQDIVEVFELSEEIAEEIVPEVEGQASYMDLSREDKREILRRVYESAH
jgi:hypothetical protein